VHAGFLEHFAHHGVLEAFARLDETRDGRIPPCGPRRLAPEQGALAVGDQHDDRGIEPREVIDAAGRAGALQYVACAAAARGRATRPAEAVAAAPVEHRARVREHAGLVRRQHAARHAQVFEAQRAVIDDGLQRTRVGEFRREVDALVGPPEQHQLVRRQREPFGVPRFEKHG
jgi:hypothetical protein